MRKDAPDSGNVIYTIGHSTRDGSEFLEILRAFEIKIVADIRTVPRSRHNPQFSKDAITSLLQQDGIDYIHLPKLGGLRKPLKDSENTGWRNSSFRGFADYMQTAEFEEGLCDLIGLSRRNRTAIMCAEAVPWRCHRSLVGDALLVRGVEVIDVLSQKESRPHSMTPWASVIGDRIIYAGDKVLKGSQQKS